ncbi:MAG: glycosyltransferase [Anaerolineales bacterium]|nr:glycosyltransferase [Anaerolineales bacterium]
MNVISIIIPAYNQAQYLAEAIQSALDQTYQDVEIIVIDDGSTDDTKAVTYSFSDPRVRYIYQENQGLSAARNTGMRHATGSLITFLDSDDLFLPDKLACLTAEMNNNSELGMVAGQAILIDEQSHRLNRMMDAPLPEELSALLLGNPIHVGSVLVKREWLEQVEPFDESLRACEDWDMWLKLARAGCQMHSIIQPVSLYRVHAEQMTRGAERMRTAMLMVLDKTFNDPDLPAKWQTQKNKAYAAAYVRAAARAYLAGTQTDGKNDLNEAVRLDPDLLRDQASGLSRELAGWANAPLAEDPLTYLEQVLDNLPDGLRQLHQRRKSVLAKFAIELAFQAHHQGNRSSTRSLVLRAFRYQPNWLRNRWALSILVKAYTR